MIRWTLETLDGLETYTFQISPNAHTPLTPNRDVTWDYSRAGFTGHRARPTPHPWEFSGVLRSQEQYDDFLTWMNKRQKIVLTTDLGQSFVIRLMAFKPSQVASSRLSKVPWRWTYTMNVLTFIEDPP